MAAASRPCSRSGTGPLWMQGSSPSLKFCRLCHGKAQELNFYAKWKNVPGMPSVFFAKASVMAGTVHHDKFVSNSMAEKLTCRRNASA